MIRPIVAQAPRRGLIAGLALSIAVHVAFSFWPAEVETPPDTVPLQASITELPPPPKPAAAAAAKPRPKPQRVTAPPAPIEPAGRPVAATEPKPPPTEPTAEAIATGPEPPTETVAAEPADAAPRAAREDASQPRRPRLQGVPRHPGLPDRRGRLPLRAHRERIPDHHDRRGEGARRAVPARAGEAREPGPDHRHRTAAARVRGRARQQGPARDRDLRLGNRNGDALRAEVRGARAVDVRSAHADVAGLFLAAGRRRPGDQHRDDAARCPLHAHARRRRDDRLGAGRDRDRALAAQERRRQPERRPSGSRRRCATSR